MSRRPTLDAVLSPKALNDIGNLLLSFVVIWMYMEWFQFMLVWIANVQVDVVWYGPRMRNGWQWVFWALVLLHFAAPFGALLLRRIKQNVPALRAVAALVLAMHLVFSYYQVLPAYGADSLRRHWMDFLLPIGWGCLWGALFAYRLRGANALAQHDPNAHECWTCENWTKKRPSGTSNYSVFEGKMSAMSASNRKAEEHAKQSVDEPLPPEEIHQADGRLEHPRVAYEPNNAPLGAVLGLMAFVICFACAHYWAAWEFFQGLERTRNNGSVLTWPQV